MNVIIPIEELTPEQATRLYKRILECVTSETNQIAISFLDGYDIMDIYQFKTLSDNEKLNQTGHLIAALNESDNCDKFGTEGWKHAFNMD